MKITLTRLNYTNESTGGVMCLGDRFFAYTLEDRLHDGPKEFGRTAIPAGRYRLVINMSERFKKRMPLLLGVPGFSGVRIHGGNTAADTLGCILVAEKRVNADRIMSSLSARLVELLEAEDGQHEIEIINAWSNGRFTV